MISTKVIDALRVATNLIRLRQEKLELYLGEVLTVNVDAALDAAQDILSTEAREAIYRLTIEACAMAVGVAVETVVPIVKIATTAHELHENLQKLRTRYCRADVDEMLDLSVQIQLENHAIERDLKLFNQLRQTLATEMSGT